MIKILLTVLTAGLVHSTAWAQASNDKEPEEKNDVSSILESMGYPELQVVPRASERLRMEALSESRTWYVTHWPIQVSALSTLYVGLTAKNNFREDLSSKQEKDAKSIATVAQAIGAGWLIGVTAFGAQRPYLRGLRNTNKYKGDDERTTLLRERLAEEALERPARTMRVLQIVSVLTNFVASGAAVIHADDNGKMTAGVSAILAFLPLMFTDHNILVHEKHIEYKKKIYAPLKSARASTSFYYDPHEKALTPMATLSWVF